jgi:hypothetical protein
MGGKRGMGGEGEGKSGGKEERGWGRRATHLIYILHEGAYLCRVRVPHGARIRGRQLPRFASVARQKKIRHPGRHVAAPPLERLV